MKPVDKQSVLLLRGPYLLRRVHVFVESFEGIDIELHELPEQIKVALQDVPGRAAAVDDAEQDVLSRDGSRG